MSLPSREKRQRARDRAAQARAVQAGHAIRPKDVGELLVHVSRGAVSPESAEAYLKTFHGFTAARAREVVDAATPRPVEQRPYYGSPAVAAVTVVGGLLRYVRAVAWLVIACALLLPFWLLVWWLA